MGEWKETEFGRLPADWDITNFGSICRLLTDGSHYSPNPEVSLNYMASVKDMRYNHFDFSSCKTISEKDFEALVKNNCSPKYGDILFSKDGANCLDIIFVYKQPEKIVLLSSIAIARLKEGFNPDFYRYFLLSPNEQFLMRNHFISGSAIPRVVLKDFNSIPVPILELKEQISIASILSSFDDKIDLLHRQNKTLESLAETLFRQWFVEEADESWEIKTISDIIEIRDGTHDSPKQSEFGFYLITSKHMKPAGIDFSTAYKISPEDFTEVNKRSKVDKNDILFSMIGTLGLIHLVNDEPDFAIKNIGLFKSSQEPWFTKFLFLLLKSSIGQKFIHESADGSTQEYITLGSLRSFEFSYPGQNSIQEFNKNIESLFNKMLINSNQIRTLIQIRDILLPKLMSGEVRVKNLTGNHHE